MLGQKVLATKAEPFEDRQARSARSGVIELPRFKTGRPQQRHLSKSVLSWSAFIRGGLHHNRVASAAFSTAVKFQLAQTNHKSPRPIRRRSTGSSGGACSTALRTESNNSPAHAAAAGAAAASGQERRRARSARSD